MRVRTRHSFAAPFVLVVACSSGGGTQPERTTPPVVTPVADPADAAIDSPEVVAQAVDASVPDAPRYIAPCDGRPDPDNKRCNNPPAPEDLMGRIYDARIVAGVLIVRVNVGVDHGVSRRSKIALVDADGKEIPTRRVEILELISGATKLRFPDRTELPPTGGRVRFRPHVQ